MRKNKKLAGVILTILIGAGLWACGGSAPVAQSQPREGRVVTAAQIFEQMKKEMQEKREANPGYMRSYAVDPYAMLDVKTEDWLATPEGRFAHSIKIPNPVPEDSGYRPGMTQQEYFELLCKNEAGEFIFKTADNVEGIQHLRPRRAHSTGEWQHLNALEDPYGYWKGEWEDLGPAFSIATPRLYSFFEINSADRPQYGRQWWNLVDASMLASPAQGAGIARYFGYNGSTSTSMKLEYDTKSRARYGITWRGIKRRMDREMGIAGGELIVLDLQTMEVMGVRRGYNAWNRSWTGRVCPRYGYHGGEDRGAGFTSWFVAKVARPEKWQEHFERLNQYRVVR